ncbi:unnamed protein product [Closterium sp. Naga37s-1]|nr:unnamed protein product [Closterium sp. Naga37s-1]
MPLTYSRTQSLSPGRYTNPFFPAFPLPPPSPIVLLASSCPLFPPRSFPFFSLPSLYFRPPSPPPLPPPLVPVFSQSPPCPLPLFPLLFPHLSSCTPLLLFHLSPALSPIPHALFPTLSLSILRPPRPFLRSLLFPLRSLLSPLRSPLSPLRSPLSPTLSPLSLCFSPTHPPSFLYALLSFPYALPSFPYALASFPCVLCPLSFPFLPSPTRFLIYPPLPLQSSSIPLRSSPFFCTLPPLSCILANFSFPCALPLIPSSLQHCTFLSPSLSLFSSLPQALSPLPPSRMGLVLIDG